MSNMLYACSILYKTRLPFILVFNKTDVQPHAFALEWMNDFEAFQEALSSRDNRDEDGEPSYMNSLMNSMSLVLDEFYKHLKAVGVSAVTGDGMAEFFEAVEGAREEYNTEYRPELDRLTNEKNNQEAERQTDSLNRLMKDLDVDKAKLAAQPPNPHWMGRGNPLLDRWGDEGDENDDDDRLEIPGVRSRQPTGVPRARGFGDDEMDEDEEYDGEMGDGLIDMSEERGPGLNMDRARRVPGFDQEEGVTWPRPA